VRRRVHLVVGLLFKDIENEDIEWIDAKEDILINLLSAPVFIPETEPKYSAIFPAVPAMQRERTLPAPERTAPPDSSEHCMTSHTVQGNQSCNELRCYVLTLRMLRS